MEYVLQKDKKWSVGQGVKTPPFHGGNTGSNPVRTMGVLWLKKLEKSLKNLLTETDGCDILI